MDNPCENKSYKLKYKILLEIEGFNFSSDNEYEFEIPGDETLETFDWEDVFRDYMYKNHIDLFDYNPSLEIGNVTKN